MAKADIISIINMKIAVYHELHKGGARRGTNEFAKQLIELGHVVDLFTIDQALKEEIPFYSNIYSYKFASKVWKGNDWKTRVYKDTYELLKLRSLNIRIAQIINRGKYDLSYVTASQFIEAPFILKFLTMPKFYYLNDPYYRMIYEQDLFHPVRKDLIRLIYEKINRLSRKYVDKTNIDKVDFVLSSSDFSGKLFQKVYRKKWVTAYYGVDTKYFAFKNSGKDIDILFIGSHDFLDGYPLFSKINQKLSKKLNIREVLVENEWLNDEQLREIYRRSKILIATSYNEPLGLIPLEAMACGVVILAVDEAGYKETIVNGKTGYLLERDENKFVNKVNFLLENINTLNKMSQNCVENVNKWTWEKRGRELEKILSDCINGI